MCTQVIAEELQSIFEDWQDTSGYLPDLCSQIAVEVGQQRSGDDMAASRWCASQDLQKPSRRDRGGARPQNRPNAMPSQLPMQPGSKQEPSPVRMPCRSGAVNASPAAPQQPRCPSRQQSCREGCRQPSRAGFHASCTAVSCRYLWGAAL